MDAYMHAVLNLRKISVVGAEQLLLDTNRSDTFLAADTSADNCNTCLCLASRRCC
jgi:hypothetical protein